MKRIKREEWPEWIREKLKDARSIEIREHKGKYYLYKCYSIWNPIKGRAVKKMKYIQTLETNPKGVKEIGHVLYLHYLLKKSGILEKIQYYLPLYWKDILVFAFNRVINPLPITRIKSWTEKVGIYEVLNGKKGKIRKMLSAIGVEQSSFDTFMRSLIKDEDFLLYDTSVLFSSSSYHKLFDVGYNKEGLLLPKLNILVLFSKLDNIPKYIRIYNGAIHEIKTVVDIVDMVAEKNVIFVADKGFYSKEIIDYLSKRHVDFIIPMRRNNTLIDYKKPLTKIFEYNERIIKCGKQKVNNFTLYLYRDLKLKAEEEIEYEKIKLLGKEVDFHRKWAGRISLISSLDLDERDVFLMWKSRDEIEKAFHTFQNILETDRPHISKEEILNGYIYCSFVGLILYYLVLKEIKIHSLLGKISVSTLMFELSKIMYDFDKNKFLIYPTKLEKLMKAISFDPLTYWDKILKS